MPGIPTSDTCHVASAIIIKGIHPTTTIQIAFNSFVSHSNGWKIEPSMSYICFVIVYITKFWSGNGSGGKIRVVNGAILCVLRETEAPNDNASVCVHQPKTNLSLCTPALSFKQATHISRGNEHGLHKRCKLSHRPVLLVIKFTFYYK